MDNSNVNIDLIRGHVDTIILRSLSSADKYGYEILKEIEDLSQGLFVLKQPTLYSCLKRLEKLNYIESYLGDESNGAQRRYYRLTESGRNLLFQDQYQWEFSRTIINNLLSDKEFDKENTPPPFNTGEFRPLTKRSVKRSETVENESIDDNSGDIEALADEIDKSDEHVYTEPLKEVASEVTSDSELKMELQKPTDKNFTDNVISDQETEIYNKQAQIKEEKINYISAFDDIYKQKEDDDQSALLYENVDIQEKKQIYEDYDYIANMGELKNRLYQDGYKLRPYSKRNTSEYYANNFFFSNKLQRDCSCICYFLFLIEAITAHFCLRENYGLKLGNLFIVLGVFLAFPLYFTIKYFRLPQKKSRTRINFKVSIVFSAILCLNLILIVCIIGFFLCGAQAGNLHSMMIPIFMPLIFLMNIPLILAVYYLLFKSKRYLLR